MADRLKGKIAIVFGAGSSGPGWGNGKAAAVAYAREGAGVACIDLNREAAEETLEGRRPETSAISAASSGRPRKSTNPRLLRISSTSGS